MAMSNIQRIGKLMELLKEGLTPFVKAEMEAQYGNSWMDEALRTLRKSEDWGEKEGEVHLDVHGLLVLMWFQWKEVFSKTLGHAERSLVSELRTVRNSWAHQMPFSTDDAQRAMDSAHRLLTAIASPLAPEAYSMSQELLRVRFDEQARKKKQQASVAAVTGKPTDGLRPWREIITPHPDVASGRYQQAEFAADLGQVYRGEGASEYLDPREFFNRTYLTEGLNHLLRNALRRLSGQEAIRCVCRQTSEAVRPTPCLPFIISFPKYSVACGSGQLGGRNRGEYTARGAQGGAGWDSSIPRFDDSETRCTEVHTMWGD